MPRVTRVSKRFQGWNETTVFILRTGLDFFDELPESHRQQAWKELQKEIMEQWLTEHPGTRPWAWWRFDLPAGTRRQRINGLHPHDDPSYSLEKKLWYGLPQYQRPCDLMGLYESEASFLKRLSLLTTAELKVLNGVN
jgi:Rad3-related DNA helicase